VGFYRGISAPMVGAAAEQSSLFFSYRLSQRVYNQIYSTPDATLPLTALVFCGAFSGAFTSFILTPIELVKCRIQVPRSLKPRISTTIVDIYRYGGVKGFWHGQMGTLIRETGGSACWFGSYEAISLALRKDKNGQSELSTQLIAGAGAGISYNVICYPADTVKSRMQTAEHIAGKSQDSFGVVARQIWRESGIKGLYRGCGITAARAAPSSAVIFAVFEQLKARFEEPQVLVAAKL
jgi:ornithine carrier protein